MLLALWSGFWEWEGEIPIPVDLPVRRGGGLRQVILKQEEKRDNNALAIFMLDG